MNADALSLAKRDGTGGLIRVRPLPFVGGRLCLDFANSVGGRHGPTPDEYLGDYADLIAWGRLAGVLDAEEAQRLGREAELRPDDAAAAFRRAIALRETIYRVFSAIGCHTEPADADVDALRHSYGEAVDRARWVVDGSVFAWRWEDATDLDRVRWPVTHSAVEVLASADLGRIKECPGAPPAELCAWLFLDTSKNASRHWCSMAECGDIAKARRQTARRRAARAGLGGVSGS
jgi:predicted RNA-binding Zn ribbon-like protein